MRRGAAIVEPHVVPYISSVQRDSSVQRTHFVEKMRAAETGPDAGDARPRSRDRRIDDRRSRRQQRAGNLGWAAGEEQTVARGRSHGADVGIDANVGPLVEPARRRGLETTGKVATVITDKIGRAHV